MTDARAAYRALAAEVVHRPAAADGLPAERVAPLPRLTMELLLELAEEAVALAVARPADGWALMAVADAAAGAAGDLPRQAQTALQLARAANAYAQPLRAFAAAARAEQLFQQLGQPAWAAAARWQQNALPWTRPNFTHAAAELRGALAEMAAGELHSLLPDCRLSLAFALALTNQYAEALALARQGDQEFAARPANNPDSLGAWAVERDPGLGRCRSLLNLAGVLRRQGQFAEAAGWLQQALELARAGRAPVYEAQVYYQLAYLEYIAHNRFQPAADYFEQAHRLFVSAGLPLWAAQARKGQAELHFYQGEFARMGAILREVRPVFAEHQVVGILADTLLEYARLETARGDYPAALAHLREERLLHGQIGAQWMVGVSDINRARAHIRLGRYQQALRDLEGAMALFRQLGLWQREAEVERDLAGLWTYLDQPARALDRLERVSALYRRATLTALPINTLNLKAEALLAQGDSGAALLRLRESLAEAESTGAQGQAGLACRLLAQLLIARGDLQEAAGYLRRAEAVFAAIGLLHEQVETGLTWGRYHQQAGDRAAARDAFHDAVAQAEGLLPEVAWQAYAGLAEIASDPPESLALYRQAVGALGQMRRDFRQPELTASFLTTRAGLFEQAVRLAADMRQAGDALAFIEQSKAQILARQLEQGQLPDRDGIGPGNAELSELQAEIALLQEQLRATTLEERAPLRSENERRLRRQLREKGAAFAELRNRLERAASGDGPDAVALVEMPPLSWARMAADIDRRMAGAPWLALDYFLTDSEVICAVLDNDGCRVRRTARGRPADLSLRQLGKPDPGADGLFAPDLARAGALLLPPEIGERLSPELTLFISPHRELHRLPWAALTLPGTGRPLVTAAAPVITPSLHSLGLLANRPRHAQLARRQALAVMVSNFQERRPALPAVRDELIRLRTMLGLPAHFLENATAAQLLDTAGPDGLAERYALLHIAGHAYHDPLTGWLSGIALHDRDWLLDELWSLAPLPALVVFSACSGSRSRVYAGDEHVSLVNTCLAAGAEQVIGSLWPVADERAAGLMDDFYARYLEGMPAAHALAAAQRTAHERGEPPAHWGGFGCVGLM